MFGAIVASGALLMVYGALPISSDFVDAVAFTEMRNAAV